MRLKRLPPTVTAPVDDEPLPPYRFRLRHQMAVAFAVLALALGVRAWWGWYAQRRLDAAIAELRAKGEPVTEADFADPAVPDEQNAAFFIRRAASAFTQSERQREDERHEKFYVNPLSLEALASIGGLLHDNRQALADIRKSRGTRLVRWDPPPLTADEEQRLDFARAIAREHRLRDLLGYGVMHAIGTGNDAEAVERLRDMLFLADRCGRRGFITAHLLSIGIAARAAAEAQAIAAELRVGESRGAAKRGQVQALILELLDSNGARQNLLDSLRRERVLSVGYAHVHPVAHRYGRYDENGKLVFHSSPEWLNVPASFVARPYALLHAERSIRYHTTLHDLLQAVDEKFLPPSPRRKPNPQTGLFGVEWVCKCFEPGGLDRVAGVHQTAMSERAGAAVALAGRLFELHRGPRPASTAELIPTYIPAGSLYLPALGMTNPATGPSTRPAAG